MAGRAGRWVALTKRRHAKAQAPFGGEAIAQASACLPKRSRDHAAIVPPPAIRRTLRRGNPGMAIYLEPSFTSGRRLLANRIAESHALPSGGTASVTLGAARLHPSAASACGVRLLRLSRRARQGAFARRRGRRASRRRLQRLVRRGREQLRTATSLTGSPRIRFASS